MAPEAPLAQRLEVVRGRIEIACRRVGRDPSGVTLLPVSKGVSAPRLREHIADGRLVRLAENRVQEGVQKAAQLRDVSPLEWHLVGRLQANKARRALESFAVVQSVDSVALAVRLDALAAERGDPARIYVQVNVDGDPAKAGFEPRGLEGAIGALAALENLVPEGLMSVGRQVDSAEAARPTFVALRSLSERLRARWPALGRGLSMGMSGDFEVAIEEGATVVRVGRAIFGER